MRGAGGECRVEGFGVPKSWVKGLGGGGGGGGGGGSRFRDLGFQGCRVLGFWGFGGLGKEGALNPKP